VFVGKKKYFSKYIFYAMSMALLLWIAFGNFRYTYYEQDLALGAVAPNADHWFGTDHLGRDLFARVSYAFWISISIGLIATTLAVMLGTTYGITAGYAGGWVDNIMMRGVDILYPIPLILIVILLMVAMKRNIGALFISISMVEWMTTARIIRAEAMKIKESGYVQVAKGLGENVFQIIGWHVLPNLKYLIKVCFLITLPGIILLESFLSFIGLGVQPPKSSLGVLIAAGANHMTTSPWEVCFPIFIFVVTILNLNSLAERTKK
jgi:oligopeptide transport system permease protein